MSKVLFGLLLVAVSADPVFADKATYTMKVTVTGMS